MTLELTNFDDSTETLYDLTAATDDIEEDVLEGILQNAVAEQVKSFYNNRDELAEQIAQQTEAPEPAEE